MMKLTHQDMEVFTWFKAAPSLCGTFRSLSWVAMGDTSLGELTQFQGAEGCLRAPSPAVPPGCTARSEADAHRRAGRIQCVPAAEPRACARHTNNALEYCHSFSSLGPLFFFMSCVLIHWHKTLWAVNCCKPGPAFCLTCCAFISNRETEQRAGDC